MNDEKIYPPSDSVKMRAHLDRDQYEALYQESIKAPESFWPKMANDFISWSQPWHTLTESNLNQGEAAWFVGGQLNACYNCVDRHLASRADQTAIIWEGDDPTQQDHISFRELHQRICRLANLLIERGVNKGDRVCLYMPMIPEAAYAMLACARIGAIHSVVFGGFSPQALQDRILDSDCQTVITADEGVRAGKSIPLKENTDKALEACPNVHTVLVVRHANADVNMQAERDIWYNDSVETQSEDCAVTPMDSEDPLFILYTSGSTGKPKGVLHTTGGYLLHAAMTHRYVFDYHDGDIYWCTADVGWVTGHTYIVYGPLANGATTLMFEASPIIQMLLVVGRSSTNTRSTFFTPLQPRFVHSWGKVMTTSNDATAAASGCLARWASLSTQRPGSGTIKSSVTRAVQSLIPGGKQRLAGS